MNEMFCAMAPSAGQEMAQQGCAVMVSMAYAMAISRCISPRKLTTRWARLCIAIDMMLEPIGSIFCGDNRSAISIVILLVNWSAQIVSAPSQVAGVYTSSSSCKRSVTFSLNLREDATTLQTKVDIVDSYTISLAHFELSFSKTPSRDLSSYT